jgi:methylphosphotriester-DNA--protein-cysteine methyltransferase
MHYNQYINMFRIRDVVELLRESIHDPLVSVDTIYLRAGFLSQSTYYKVFKDVMHFSPVVFKKKLAQAYRQNP